ncbi:proton-coupled amino acid transporter-like protein CG1139 [Aricia agestis]|uniref:proton-coupled amino acid transporter-like protein CG1139 n=1 Tax=Aricia agestis TaxID=91739 RepID=UPI001C203E11|nr:proton-coupled amino acid transporter-like protein CG1139 [Aricia agestis]
MFIYKFMAGVVEQLKGSEGEEFDPHEHRKVEKPTTYSQTMTHLLKGCIGAGVLAMPNAFSRVGIIGSFLLMLLIGIFATYCIHVLIAAQYELCKRKRVGYMTFAESMALALQEGPLCMRWASKFSYYFVDAVLILWQLGICVIYCVFVGENMHQVCDFHGLRLALRWHIVYLIAPLIVICLIKDLRLLSPVSSVSNALTLLGLIILFFYLIEDDVEFDYQRLEMKSILEIPIFIGTALFALEAVGVILALEYNMENPKRFVTFFGLFNIGMTIIVAVYIMVGVFGFLKYGDDIKASITLNLPQEEKKAQAAKILLAVAIFLSFPLQNFVAYSMIWLKLKEGITNKSKKYLVDYSLRIVLVIIPWVLAVAVPTLGPFISFFGAFCLSLLAIIFPGLMDICIWYPNNYGVLHYRLLRDLFMIIIGLSSLVSGCYTSLLEVYESMT